MGQAYDSEGQLVSSNAYDFEGCMHTCNFNLDKQTFNTAPSLSTLVYRLRVKA